MTTVTSTAEIFIDTITDDRSYEKISSDSTPSFVSTPTSQTVKPSLDEGYRDMASIHMKYAETAYKAISEVVPY